MLYYKHVNQDRQMKILFTVLTIGFLVLSIVYDRYARDPELQYLQHLPKGTLKVKQQTFINSQHNMVQINLTQGLNISYDANRSLINAKGQAFLLGMKGDSTVQANGDSFYRVTDSRMKVCSEQIVSQLQMKNTAQLVLKGHFQDCQHSDYTITIKKQGKKLSLHAQINSHYNRVMLRFGNNEEDHYFGLGEQFSHVNLGQNRPYSMFVRQKGVGRTDQPETSIINMLHTAGGSYYYTYSPSPIWLSSRKMGYVLNSYRYSAWINNEILVWHHEIDVTILVAQTFKELLRDIANINGYTPLVPKWVNEGAIVGLQGGTQAVQDKYNELKKANAVISGLWLQDWVSKRQSNGYSRLWWNWQLDVQHYPLWHALRTDLAEDNVNLLLYINPMMTEVADKQKFSRNLYQQAKQLGCFITDNSGKIFQTSAFSQFTAALINFDKQECRQYYQQLLRDILNATGAKGMMVDFGEGYPVQNIHANVSEAVKKHNEYPVVYHQAVREVLDEYEDLYTFTRAGFLHAPRYIHSLWTGDQNMNFKKHSGLPSCLNAMLSSGLTGYSNTHCDIGGYTFFDTLGLSYRTPLLMTRWMQLSAFSPVFRSHEGSMPDKSLQVYSNIRIAEQFAMYSHVFSILAPYRAQQAQKSAIQKIPLIRPLFLEHSENPETFTVNDQYYLGDDMLVAPIIGKKMARNYYLPSGNWTNIWTGATEEGCDCSKDSNSFMPPVFIRESSEFMRSIVDKIGEVQKKYHLVVKSYNEYKDSFFDL